MIVDEGVLASECFRTHDFGKMSRIIACLIIIWSFCFAWADESHKTEGVQFAAPGGVPLLMDIRMPADIESPPLVVWIHGGGWKGGSRKNVKIPWVVDHGYALASIEYRLSQEAVFPAQIHDCKGAIRWLRAHASDYGFNAEKIVVAGSSAGGHLVALLGTGGGVLALEGETGGHLDQSSSVQGVIDYYGATDFIHRSKTQPSKTEQSSGSVFGLLGGKVSENVELARLASPITHLDGGDPPFLILHGAKDKTVFVDQSENFHRACEEKGVAATLLIHQSGGHGWKTPMKGEREAILDFLAKWLGKPESSASN